MQIRTQLSVWLANEPGVLADLLASLQSQEINLLGLSVQDSVDHAIVRLLPDKPLHAIHLLEEEGTHVHDVEVLYLKLEHTPGAFQRVAAALAEAGVNIHYTYGCGGPTGEAAYLVLRPSSLPDAVKALRTLGFEMEE